MSFGAAGALLLLIALIVRVVRISRPVAARAGTGGRVAWIALAAALASMPLNGLQMADYLRSLVGDPSLTLVVLLVLSLVEYAWGRPLVDPRERRAVPLFALPAGILLYPGALGWGYFDPYALGYSSLTFLLVLALAALAAWFARQRLLLVCLLVAVIGRTFEVLESRNFWDYLIDPMLVGYGLIVLARALRTLMTATALTITYRKRNERGDQ